MDILGTLEVPSALVFKAFDASKRAKLAKCIFLGNDGN
jgi:hypothetical protein